MQCLPSAIIMGLEAADRAGYKGKFFGTWTSTDPDFVDITNFTATTLGTFDEDLEEEGGNTITVRTRVVRMRIAGELVLDRTISREIEDRIKLRNDLVF